MLVEKMVNPKTVTESPHVLPAKSSQPGFVPFSPVQYLITTQKVSLVGFLNLHFYNVSDLRISAVMSKLMSFHFMYEILHSLLFYQCKIFFSSKGYILTKFVNLCPIVLYMCKKLKILAIYLTNFL